MKLWKRTVILMLATLLVSLLAVGGLTLYLMGRRSFNNAAETYGQQLSASASMMGQFWDASKYEGMTETGKKSYLSFQFEMCCGNDYALIDRENGETAENFTDYNVIGLENLKLSEDAKASDYQLQQLNGKILLLQKISLNKPEGYDLMAIHNITDVVDELKQTALWFLGIYGVTFLAAGLFIYGMMRRTVEEMENLQEVAEKQEMLLGALAHEMRTPLTSIIGYADTLRHARLDEDQKDRALEHIGREGRRMEQMSGKLMQMLGLHKNNAVRMEHHSAQALVDRVYAAEKEQAEKRKIELHTSCRDFSMKMDAELMESLLINLVDNAFRASNPGDCVFLEAFEEAGKKYFVVKDRGKGIPREEIQKVKEAFYMVDKSRTRMEGGAGLGLALCERIVTLHNGTLNIESKAGEGTKVTAVF